MRAREKASWQAKVNGWLARSCNGGATIVARQWEWLLEFSARVKQTQTQIHSTQLSRSLSLSIDVACLCKVGKWGKKEIGEMVFVAARKSSRIDGHNAPENYSHFPSSLALALSLLPRGFLLVGCCCCRHLGRTKQTVDRAGGQASLGSEVSFCALEKLQLQKQNCSQK